MKNYILVTRNSIQFKQISFQCQIITEDISGHFPVRVGLDQWFSKWDPDLQGVPGGPQQKGESFIFTIIPSISNTIAAIKAKVLSDGGTLGQNLIKWCLWSNLCRFRGPQYHIAIRPQRWGVRSGYITHTFQDWRKKRSGKFAFL